MIEPSFALQKAVRARLIASAAVTALVPSTSILDTSGPVARFPSIIIGEGQTVDARLNYERDMDRAYLDLHVWAKADDLGPVKAMAGAVREAIRAPAPWSIEGHRLIDLVFPMIRFLRDRDADTPLAHGVVSIEALLQRAAT